MVNLKEIWSIERELKYPDWLITSFGLKILPPLYYLFDSIPWEIQWHTHRSSIQIEIQHMDCNFQFPRRFWLITSYQEQEKWFCLFLDSVYSSLLTRLVDYRWKTQLARKRIYDIRKKGSTLGHFNNVSKPLYTTPFAYLIIGLV